MNAGTGPAFITKLEFICNNGSRPLHGKFLQKKDKKFIQLVEYQNINLYISAMKLVKNPTLADSICDLRSRIA